MRIIPLTGQIKHSAFTTGPLDDPLTRTSPRLTTPLTTLLLFKPQQLVSLPRRLFQLIQFFLPEAISNRTAYEKDAVLTCVGRTPPLKGGTNFFFS